MTEKEFSRVFSENLTRLLEMKKASQTDLANYLDVSVASVNYWCRGIKVPRMDKVDKMCKFFGVQRSDLMSEHRSSNPIVLPAVRIPVYGQIPAGIPLEAVENILDWEEISPEATADGSEYIALKVQGTSMYPKYMDGDVVIVRVQPDCESGQDAVVYVNGYDATLKKVLKKTDCVILQPLNPEYEPMVYDYNDELNPVTILGVVKEIRRKV